MFAVFHEGMPATRKSQINRLVHEALSAIRWFDEISSGPFATIQEFAIDKDCCLSLIIPRTRSAFLAQAIVDQPLQGRHRRPFTVARQHCTCPSPLCGGQ